MAVRGHITESNQRQKAASERRAKADQRGRLLTTADLEKPLNAAEVLWTTIGGEARQITGGDLTLFKRNMELAKKSLSGSGITARQILDLASHKPLKYRRPDIEKAISDVDKARREIRTALPLSLTNGRLIFQTNASAKSKKTHHYVRVHLQGMPSALKQLEMLEPGDAAGIRKIAKWLKKQPIHFECDCERFDFSFRYVATIGGFVAGRKEHAYPKIINPGLKGVACMHAIRAANELDSSLVVEGFLERHLRAIKKSAKGKARTQMTEKQAEQLAKNPARKIKTTDDRKREAAQARERRAIRKAFAAARAMAVLPNGTKRVVQSMTKGMPTSQLELILKGGS